MASSQVPVMQFRHLSPQSTGESAQTHPDGSNVVETLVESQFQDLLCFSITHQAGALTEAQRKAAITAAVNAGNASLSGVQQAQAHASGLLTFLQSLPAELAKTIGGLPEIGSVLQQLGLVSPGTAATINTTEHNVANALGKVSK